MKFVKLLGHAYVNGVLRSAAEGVLHLSNEEGQRLIDAQLAEDVSADFSAEDHENVPVETVSAVPVDVDAVLASEGAEPQPKTVAPDKPAKSPKKPAAAGAAKE